MSKTGLMLKTQPPGSPFAPDRRRGKDRGFAATTLFFLSAYCLPMLLLALLLTAPDNAMAEENPDDSTAPKATSPNTESEATLPSEATSPSAETKDTAEATEPVKHQRIHAREEANRHSAIQPHMALFQQSEQLVPLTSNEEVFYGLFQQERSGKPQGGLLILHDLGQHGLWPDYIAPVREQLPDFGWVTLAIELPDPPAQPLPLTNLYQASAAPDSEADSANAPATANAAQKEDEKTSPDANAANEQTTGSPPDEELTQTPPPENDNSEPDEGALPGPVTPDSTATADASSADDLPAKGATTDTEATEPPPGGTSTSALSLEKQRSRHRQQSLDRIHHAVTYLNTRGQYNLVLIANGISASWATQWLLAQLRANSENDDAAPAAGLALILINPKESSAARLKLLEQMAQLPIPILELNIQPTAAEQALAHQRRGTMKHAQRHQYRQTSLSAPLAMGTHQQRFGTAGMANHNPLVRQLRGWLKTNAAGTEVGR